MKATPTRTLNPLPFSDLEPHRFEDLVRQLAYDLRRWKSLEATGRGGADGGVDIRAIELVPVDQEPTEDEEEKDEKSAHDFIERQWIFQCKREKALAPKRIRMIVEESLAAVDGKRWDAIFDRDTIMHMAKGELKSAHAWSVDEMSHSDRSAHGFWNEYIDESRRAILKIRRAVPLDRILALDPLGDGYFPVPHILVEFVDKTGPFTDGHYSVLERGYPFGGQIDIDLGPENRAPIFPKPLPISDENEPAGFDDTDKGVPLTTATKENLEGLLTKVEDRRKAETREITAADPSLDGNGHSSTIRDFQQWRVKVAVPVFSSFVHRLQASGHRGRVVIASGAPGSPEENRSRFERVELKMRLRVADYFNPVGHVRISCSQYPTTWQTNIAPASKDGRGLHRSSEVGQSIDATWTKEQLESLVLTVLQRMDAELG